MEQHRAQVLAARAAALRAEWGAAGAEKIRCLEQEEQRGLDLLSLLVGKLRGKSGVEGENHCLEKVRSPTYSIVDLFTEVCALEQSIREVLGTTPGLRAPDGPRAMALVTAELRHFVKNALQHTSEVYERVVESGGRGFCQVDRAGRIVYANPPFRRLTGAEDPVGKPLESFFDRFQESAVTAALRGSKPELLPLRIRTADGRDLLVGAEIGPLTFGGENCGGYAGLVDISGPMEIQARIFDQSPLGIIRINRNREFTYANPAVLRMLGAEMVIGRHVREIFDEANYAKVEQELLLRLKGFSSQYEVDFKRLSDGRSLPVMLAAMPEYDLQGNVIGAVSIARSVLLERTASRIHERIKTLHEAPRILQAVAEEVARVLPFDLFTVAVYSEDRRHSRTFYSSQQANSWETLRRWWMLSEAMSEWIDAARQPFGGDVDDYLADPRWQALKEDHLFQSLLNSGAKYFVTIPIVRGDHVVATATAFARTPFHPDDVAVFMKLPVDQAVLMAMNCEGERELQFRLDLMAKVSLASDNSKGVAQVVVDALAEHYGWSDVAIFQVDYSAQHIRLVAQKCVTPETMLPEDFKQPIRSGVLGYVCEQKKSVNITDVHHDAHFQTIFIDDLPGTVSELCLPVLVDGRVQWLLNVEDPKENAFAPEEQVALDTLLAGLAGLLERSRQHSFLKAIRESVSDAILVTDEQDRVRAANPAVELLLGYTEAEIVDQPFSRFFRDPESARALLQTSGSRTDHVVLRKKDGRDREVLLSVSPLPEASGSRVFTAKDLLPYQQAERLEVLERVYAEIASQTRTPLSLIHTWLQDLQQRSSDPEAVEILQKMREQLRSVGLTYDRLLLAQTTGASVPYREVLLDWAEVLEAVRRDLPKTDLAKIEVVSPANLPPVRGDLYQLRFCLVTILSHLLRYAPQDRRIRLTFSSQNGDVTAHIEGVLPELTEERTEPSSARTALARTLVELSLGAAIIRQFLANQRGTFKEARGPHDEAHYQIILPAATEA